MRFITPVAKRYTVVVRPAGRIIINGIPEAVPGLRAKFRNGVFDSMREQTDKGWTIEERKQVEAKLLRHPDFQKHNGFYLERIDGEGLPPEVGSIASLRCTAFFRNESGEPEQCPHDTVGGTDYCDDHQIEVDVQADAVAAETEAEATPVPPVSVMAD